VLRYVNGALSGKALFGSDYPLLERAVLLQESRDLGLKEKTMKAMTEDNPARLLIL
jgi:predicted TIM-barrel fold metal-dependent hydrolase